LDSNNSPKISKYDQLGASASKAGLHKALDKAGLSEDLGLFAKVNSDIAGNPDYYSFLHADGAGTKSIIAYLIYRETGSTSAFANLAHDALAMNLDDIFCLGIPENLLLSNTIGRNAKLINDDAVSEIISSYKKLTEMLATQGIDIELSGGETADCGDVVRTLMVDAVLAGRIKKQNIIDPKNIVPGDIIVGLSNTGKASYEKTENSSVASNGLTLARHCLLSKDYKEKYPEIVDENIKGNAIAYGGPFKVTDTPEGLGMTIGEALSSPTRTFAPVLAKIYQALPGQVHGAIHTTGGGLTKVLRFGKGNVYVKNNLFPTPPLYSLIQEHGNVQWREMYQVFNMGHRLELYLDKAHLSSVIEIAKIFNIEAQQIGVVEKSTGQTNKVRVESKNGTFEYTL
jgi:phosphoribosylformylglycinamidine cyclo-ligase